MVVIEDKVGIFWDSVQIQAGYRVSSYLFLYDPCD